MIIIIIIILLELSQSIHQQESSSSGLRTCPNRNIRALISPPGFDPPRTSSLCKCAISRAGCPLSMSSHDLSRLYTRTPPPFRRQTFSIRASFTYRPPWICSAINPTSNLFFFLLLLLLSSFLLASAGSKDPSSLIIKICTRRSSILSIWK